MFKKLWTTAMALWCAFIPFLSQVTVTATWINVSEADVNKVLTPLTNWFWSYANVIIAFASVIIVVWFIKLLSRKFNKW